MTDHSSPEKSPWGWKALIIFCILGGLFMLFFWLAVSNEPDYMPSQQSKQSTQQHAFKNAPAMSEEAMAEAQKQKEAREAGAPAPAAARPGADSRPRRRPHAAPPRPTAAVT